MTAEIKARLAEKIQEIKSEEENLEIKYKREPEKIQSERDRLHNLKNEEKKNAIPIQYRFKCKYFVPNASAIVKEKRKNVSNIYLQVSAEVKRENFFIKKYASDQEISLYNVTNTRINYDSIEQVP